MNTKELKTILIDLFSEIEDKSFLEVIKVILDSKSQKEQIIKLSPEIKSEIIASQQKIEKGTYIENNQLVDEIEGWLNSK
ncbi:MAG: hypothetical protein ACJA08_003516 [Cyclobacteriaceae bacterium]|jgi:hypothetical protein